MNRRRFISAGLAVLAGLLVPAKAKAAQQFVGVDVGSGGSVSCVVLAVRLRDGSVRILKPPTHDEFMRQMKLSIAWYGGNFNTLGTWTCQ